LTRRLIAIETPHLDIHQEGTPTPHPGDRDRFGAVGRESAIDSESLE